ncbi:FAD-dependent oxidoreductase, partial [Chloroflexota bacterium]
EIEAAEEEGIEINILAAPVKVLAQGGRVTGMECIKMELGEPDASGRRRPIPVKGSEFEMKIDTVIMALGQTVDKAKLPDNLEYMEWGTLSVDEITLQTNIEGVFAGGDVVSGPADVISVVAAGKEAAISIDRYLRGVDLKEGRPAPRERVKEINKEGVETKPRQSMPVLEPEKRPGFTEVELGFDDETAIDEAKRCLNCAVCSECLECVKVCQPVAINHDMEVEYQDIEVGAIIVATGYDTFDPTSISQYGYKRYDNVITGLEFERMCSSTGPTGGEIVLKDGSAPQSVAIIHCVGSRDENYYEYCSRICCMYGLKHAHLIKEKTGAEVYQMYIDMRCFGKGYEEFYKRVSDEGINFIRGKPAQVTDVAISEEEKGKLIVVGEDTLLGSMIRVPVDMVILSVAIGPRSDAGEVAGLFSLEQSADGFLEESDHKFDPVGTVVDGIYIAGCCQGPKDIPDTVAQASAAAAKALSMITKGEVRMEAETEMVAVAKS